MRISLRHHYFLRDVRNLFLYGKHAPRSAQLIYVDPRKIRSAYCGAFWEEELPQGMTKTLEEVGPDLGRGLTGCVLMGDWDLKLVDLELCPKYRMCVEHFRDNRTWEETGAYELMMRIIRRKPGADGIFSEADVFQRYERLDDVFRVVSTERRLRTRGELKSRNFRESGGVFVHIGRDAEVLFAGGGFHRLAIAKVLGLESIPAQLGVVHQHAIRTWRERCAMP